MKTPTRLEAAQAAETLNLPMAVTSILNDQVPTVLKNFISSPVIFSLSNSEQEAYNLGNILPLWSTANGNVIYAYDHSKCDYFSFYLDGGVKARFSSWEDLIVENIARIIDILWDEQTQDEIAQELKEILSDFEISDVNKLLSKALED